MPKIAYIPWNPGPKRRVMINKANEIITEYRALGFELTLRQLYYQFVARGLIKNSQLEYNRLGTCLNSARLAGMVDWNAIVDRTRYLRKHSSWDNPADIIHGAAYSYARDWWVGQAVRVEVWIEKDALIGVIEPSCSKWQVPYISCRGYTSQSEMWSAAQRYLLRAKNDEQDTLVLHFGDHDPSGIDMSRDIEERIRLFMGPYSSSFDIRRIALNMDQVEQYNPPPNPAKMSDARAHGYVEIHGYQSWELDALEPRVIAALIEAEILSAVDVNMIDDIKGEQTQEKTQLEKVARRWEDVVNYVAEN